MGTPELSEGGPCEHQMRDRCLLTSGRIPRLRCNWPGRLMTTACRQSEPGKQLRLSLFVRIGRGRTQIGIEKRRCDCCGMRNSCFCDSMRGTGASTFLRMRNPREGATGFGIGMYARCFCNREDRTRIVIRKLKWHRMDCGLIWRLLQEKNAICAAACASV